MLVIYLYHGDLYSDLWKSDPVSIKYGLRTADHRLGIKHALGIK